MSALIAFKQKAEELGATIVTHKPFSPVKKACFHTSVPSGGCGSKGCRCSPGLWITLSTPDEIATAQFGSGSQRGGSGNFEREDFHNWEKLIDFAKNLTK